MDSVERQYSDFLRQPKEVVADLEKHHVVYLKRRNAPALRLSRVDRDEANTEALQVGARLIRFVAKQLGQQEVISHAVEEVFPWVVYLPPADQRTFVEEFTTALLASAELENFARVHQLVREWRNAAEIHSDPELAARLQKPLNVADNGSVPKP